MATIDFEGRSRTISIAAGIFLIAVVAFLLRSWMSPPQIGSDEDVFKTVDALFTAISSRDKQQLQACERRLREFRRDGRIPSTAANCLDAIIKQANSGQWRESAKVLYDFMLAQRGT